jgi:hypothetical protein
MPTLEELSSEDEGKASASSSSSESSSSSSGEEQDGIEPEEEEEVVTPLDLRAGGKRNRPRVPSIEEVTEQDLFGDIGPPEPEPLEPAKRSIKDQANEIVRQKDFHGAAALYTEALAEVDSDAPERVMLLSNLALCMLKTKQWKECVNAASQALELDMDHTKALFRRGQARRELGELASARSDLERSLETAPPKLAPAIRTALAEVNRKITGTAGPALPPEFTPLEAFDGPRDGYEFKKGPQGMGYYSTAGSVQGSNDDGLSYEEAMQRRKVEWKNKTKNLGGCDDEEERSDEQDQTRTRQGSDDPSNGEKEAVWKTRVREGWSIVVSSAIPQVIAIGIWVVFVCGVAYLWREEIKLGGRVPSTTAGLSLSAAFGGLLEVGTLADHTTAIGLVTGGPAAGLIEQQVAVVVTTRETLQLWEYTSSELGSDLELRYEATFHLKSDYADLGPAITATVFSWPEAFSRRQAKGLENWGVVAGFESGEVRVYKGGGANLRAQQRVSRDGLMQDEFVLPNAQMQLLPERSAKHKASRHKQQLTAVAAIAIDSGGKSASESKSTPQYHLIAVLVQDLNTCTESQQHKTCEQVLHVLSWDPVMDTISTIGSSVPPVGKSNTITLVTPFAAGRPGFLMLDVKGTMMTLSGIPRSAAVAQQKAERSLARIEGETTEKVVADISSKGGGSKADVEAEEFFNDDAPATPTSSGVTLQLETCTNSATPTPFGDTAGLSWAPDPLMPTNFYTMHSRGARKVSLHHVRLDAVGDDRAGMCHNRVVQTAGTPEPPALPLHRVCPMHGYLLGLGESVSLWNVTGKTGGGGSNTWPVLIGGSEAKSEGLSGKFSGIGKVLKQSESCRAAVVGQHEWLLLQKPASEKQEDSSTEQMGRREYLNHLSEGGPITERPAGSSLVLVRSSLPFEHVTYNIKYMIYAVR